MWPSPVPDGHGEEEDQQLRREVQGLTTLDPTAPDRPGGEHGACHGPRGDAAPLNVNREHGSRFARYLPWRVPDPGQRSLLMKTLLRSLVTLDVDIDCPDLVCHQRDTADGKLFFLVNTADEERRVTATFYALGRPEEWDPETGEVRRVWQYARAGEKVTLPLHFAPRQARVLSFSGTEDLHVERANFVVTRVTETDEHYLVEGHARTTPGQWRRRRTARSPGKG